MLGAYLWSLDKCNTCVTQTHTNTKNITITTESSPSPSSQSLLPFPQKPNSSDLSPIDYFCFFYNYMYKLNHTMCFFMQSFFHLAWFWNSPMLQHVSAAVHSFLPWSSKISSYEYTSLLIPFLIMDCFQFSALRKELIWTLLYRYFSGPTFSFLLCKYLGVEFLGGENNLSIMENLKLM